MNQKDAHVLHPCTPKALPGLFPCAIIH